MTRLLRSLVGIGALAAMVLFASACSGGQAPAPTPDPFAGLADRSDQAFRQGLEAYGQGQYRDALTAFEQAKTLSPTDDPRIGQMIDRTKAAMAPSPTAVPPTPTDVPPTPTATTVPMSQVTPDNDLGQRYFGKVTLAVVPGKDSDAPAATQFFFQDQIGLHIEGLAQHLRLPFTLRVFNTDTGKLVATVNSDDNPAASGSSASPTPQATTATLVAPATTLSSANPQASPTAAATATSPVGVVRFWDTYVWYHTGGEDPGRYRAELYANGILTNTFDFTVGTVPVPTPSPQVQDAQPAFPSPTDVPVEDVAPPPPAPVVVPPTPRPAPPAPAPAPAQPAPVPPTPTPQPTAIPSPTAIPTPATADTTQVGGVPAGMDTDSASGRSYLVDASGVIWTTDAATGAQRPSLGTPWYAAQGQQPVDLTVDQSTGFLYLPATRCQRAPGNDQAPANPNCVLAIDGRGSATVLKSMPLDGAPTQVRVDSSLGLLFVAIPSRQEIQQLDIRSGTTIRPINDGANTSPITSLALDPYRQALYAAHLDGEVAVLDETSGRVLVDPRITTAGLTSVATARGLVYGVNTVMHELDVLEPVSGYVSRFPLSQEPAAVAAAEDSGAVYVLSSRNDVILQLDPTDGSELGRVNMNARSAHLTLDASANVQTLRPRIALQQDSDTVFATIPDQGTLAAVGDGEFPTLARDIPYVGSPAQPLVASMDSTTASSDAEEGI